MKLYTVEFRKITYKSVDSLVMIEELAACGGIFENRKKAADCVAQVIIENKSYVTDFYKQSIINEKGNLVETTAYVTPYILNKVTNINFVKNGIDKIIIKVS